jgi:hypothetical protein
MIRKTGLRLLVDGEAGFQVYFPNPAKIFGFGEAVFCPRGDLNLIKFLFRLQRPMYAR